MGRHSVTFFAFLERVLRARRALKCGADLLSATAANSFPVFFIFLQPPPKKKETTYTSTGTYKKITPRSIDTIRFDICDWRRAPQSKRIFFLDFLGPKKKGKRMGMALLCSVGSVCWFAGFLETPTPPTVTGFFFAVCAKGSRKMVPIQTWLDLSIIQRIFRVFSMFCFEFGSIIMVSFHNRFCLFHYCWHLKLWSFWNSLFEVFYGLTLSSHPSCF